MKTNGIPTQWLKQRQGPDESRYIIGPEIGNDPGRFIARMDNQATDEEWSLVTASPELLRSLEELFALACCPENFTEDQRQDMLDTARAARANATGDEWRPA